MAEEKKMKRTLHIGERIWCDEPNEDEADLCGLGTITLINGKAEDYTIEDESGEWDTIVTVELDGHCGECEEEAIHIYQIDNEQSARVGGVVCLEHWVEDYPYYVPELGENFFEFEMGAAKSRINRLIQFGHKPLVI